MRLLWYQARKAVFIAREALFIAREALFIAQEAVFIAQDAATGNALWTNVPNQIAFSITEGQERAQGDVLVGVIPLCNTPL